MKNTEIIQKYLNNERPYLIVQGGVRGKTVPITKREIGEEWEDSKGFIWQQKNGYKIRCTKMGKTIREARSLNNQCKCGQTMEWGDKLDKKFYNKTGKCVDCLLEFETILRVNGNFQYYELKKLIRNQNAQLKELKNDLIGYLEYLKTDKILQFVHETGHVDEWANTEQKTMIKDCKKEITKVSKQIKSNDIELGKIEKLCSDSYLEELETKFFKDKMEIKNNSSL